ncbi:MAG: DUF3343 domain-containing protein [Nitrospinae bacterium]|nr:DUF3343 domain-containing protein [Nitrospinota bacterium]
MNDMIFLVYNTTHETLKAESLLRDRMIKVRPIIKPVKIKSSCGMALQVKKDTIPVVLEINDNEDFTFIGFFVKGSQHWEKVDVL